LRSHLLSGAPQHRANLLQAHFARENSAQFQFLDRDTPFEGNSSL
jgi:hypothetical protein